MPSPIRIAILANGRQARAEAAVTARAYGLMGRKVSSAGKLIAGAFAVTSIVRAGAAVVKTGGAYVGSLNKIQALTDSSNRVMDKAASRLEGNAGLYAKMGQTTGDAAAGVVELTKAGLSLNSSLAAVKATMTLAKAGELEVADASTLVANTLNTFSLKAKDAGKIANGLANAANISSADVSDLAESFKYVSPIAAKAGVSLDQTNAILAELSNSGVKASQAGTGLRKFLLSLQAPGGIAQDALDKVGLSVYDAAGKMRPLPALIEDMRKGLGKLSTEEQNHALKNIFGLTGITSAQIILKNGADGLKEYTKGVQRAGAAQKLANAQSKGLLGTLQKLKATGVSTIQSLYRQFSPKLNKPLAEAAGWLAKNQDEMIATGKAAAAKLVPALQELWTAAGDVTKALKDTAVPLAKDLLPALKETAKVGLGVVKFFNSLPGPVKEIGVQAGIAALVMPRLTSAVTAATTSFKNGVIYARVLGAEMTDTATRGRLLQNAMTRLSGAAKTAAGIGGMVALTQAAQTSNKALSVLGMAAGGAALGFSVGGPLGAAIGGTAGGLLGLWRAGQKAGDGFGEARSQALNFADSLNQVTGAATRANRAQVLAAAQQDGLISLTNRLGINTKDLIGATLGNAAATRRVNDAYQRHAQLLDGSEQARFNTFLRQNTNAFRQQSAQIRQNHQDTLTWKQALKGLPHNQELRAKVKAIGVDITAGQLRRLKRQYDLTPKQLKIITRATGTELVVKKIHGVYQVLRAGQKVKANLNPFIATYMAGLGRADRQGRGKTRVIAHGLFLETAKAKANLNPFVSTLRMGLGRAQGTASSGGRRVGANLKAGVLDGFSGTAGLLAAEAAAAVRGAVSAARAAGDIHSPSRKMHKVGTQLGEGLAGGMKAKEKDAKKGGRSLIQQVLAGVRSGGAKSALGKITALINKTLDGKSQTARRKALLKSYRDEYAAIIRNGKAQAKDNKQLDAKRQKLKDLIRDAKQYAREIKTSIVDYGSVVGLGTNDQNSNISLKGLLSQLKARAEASARFSALIKRLRRSGLNRTAVQDLLDAGVEGGLATAEAITSGGKSAIRQINSLTTQIASTGSSLGAAMKHAYKDAGIQAAQGLVDGLKKRQRALDQIATRLATSLVQRVKKALGIKSPSRVFRDLGRQTVKGLTIGLRDVPVKRAGAVLAGDLQAGFGQPALAAYMSTASGGGRGGDTFNINVTAPVGSSSVDIGRTIVKHIDAYKGAGGRTRA